MESSLTERATWRDYYELCKPNVVWLMILTAIVGMCMATTGAVPMSIVVAASVGIALCAASAATVNHLADQHIDAVMARTSGRPIVKGKIDSQGAAIFALVLGCVGMVVLLKWVNALTAWLTLASLVGYAFIYTFYLKRATPQNIVIGGLAGAMPPLLGWTAVTNQVDGNALLLVLIIFAWTPPHFWALAIARKEEYAKVEIPMLPVTHGSQYTCRPYFVVHPDALCLVLIAGRNRAERLDLLGRCHCARCHLHLPSDCATAEHAQRGCDEDVSIFDRLFDGDLPNYAARPLRLAQALSVVSIGADSQHALKSALSTHSAEGLSCVTLCRVAL
jgi:protoheme IX farnesyltransferase